MVVKFAEQINREKDAIQGKSSKNLYKIFFEYAVEL